MAVRIEEWTQSHWITGGVTHYANYGDYAELSNLIPSLDERQLIRLPRWVASQVDTDTNGLTDVRGAFWDAANDRVVLVGANGSSDLTAAYLDSAWSLSANTVLHTTPSNLGGQSGRNIADFGAVLYVIGSNGKVYSSADYTTAMAEFDPTTTHHILAVIDEHLWVVHTTCQIQQTLADNSAFQNWDTPHNDLGDPQMLLGYHGYLLLIVRDKNGLIRFYRVPVNASTRYFNELTHCPEAGSLPSYGCLFVLHGDEVYFSPGYFHRPGGEIGLNVYAFNGSRIEQVDRITHDPNAGGSGFPASAGLLSWRGELLYYALEGTAQTFKIFRHGRFVEFPALAATATTNPLAAVVGDHLICTVNDGSEGIQYLTDATLQDAYVITSWLDMNRPAKQKRLEQLTVLLDTKASSFKPTIKYRTDDTTSWTTAVAGNNSRRVSVVSLGVDFYTIQIQVLLDDDTGNDEDIRIEKISALYTVNT